MEKLPVMSGLEVIKVLSGIGFDQVGQKGSHVRMKGEVDDSLRVVIIPLHKELTRGTLMSIIRQAGLTKDEFIDLADGK